MIDNNEKKMRFPSSIKGYEFLVEITCDGFMNNRVYALVCVGLVRNGECHYEFGSMGCDSDCVYEPRFFKSRWFAKITNTIMFLEGEIEHNVSTWLKAKDVIDHIDPEFNKTTRK